MGYDLERRREYARKWYAARRAKWLVGKSCACGSSEGLKVFHADSDKKIPPGIWSWSEANRHRILAEAIVLCRTCQVVRYKPSFGLGCFHYHKLTEVQVEEIRMRYEERADKLAVEYGVHKTTIYRIFSGSTWTHPHRALGSRRLS